MKLSVRKRVERLEAEERCRRESVLQIGPLRRLPEDFIRERHIVMVSRKRTEYPNYEVCEFEERVGPAPPSPPPDGWRLYISEDDMNL